ncbi:putative RNA-binding protein 15B [Styela clava]
MKRQGEKDSPSRNKRSKVRNGSPTRRTYSRHSSPHHRDDRNVGRRNSAYGKSEDSYSPSQRFTPPPHRDDRRREGREPSRGSYKVLLVKNFSSQISDVDIEESLYYEYKKFGDVSVKVSTDNRGDRVAYATFRSSGSANDAKNAKGHLVMYDRRLTVEAVYERREKKTRTLSPLPVPDTREREPNYRKRSPSFQYDAAPSPRRRSLSPASEGKSYSVHNSPTNTEPTEPNILPEDDPYATRTLFLGNLEADIGSGEIRRCFEVYGRVEDIDIKRSQRGVAYAFVRFSNLDMAYKAKVAMQGKPILKFPVKIGYGKVFHSSKLWVGGLGHWTSLSVLEREFDRFGAIRKIDYEKGTSYAYILYESIDAAQAACSQMRGCTLHGSDIRLRIDFADPDPGMPGYEAWLGRKNYSDRDYHDRGGHSRDKRHFDRNDDRGNFYRKERPRERFHNDRGRPYDRGNKGNRGQDGGRRSPERYNKRSNSDKKSSPNRASVVVSETKNKGPHEFERRYIPAQSEDAELNFKHDQMKIATDLHALCQILNPPCWDGAFVLKKTAFAVRFFLLDGDVGLINNMITTITAQGLPARISFLHITQRLRQDEDKLRDVSRRLKDPDSKTCLLLAVPGMPTNVSKADSGSVFTQQRPLRGLVKYFKDKDAAGVVAFHGPNPQPDAKKDKVTLGMLHAFPPGQFANDHLFSLAPCLNPSLIIEEYMVIVVARGSSASS